MHQDIDFLPKLGQTRQMLSILKRSGYILYKAGDNLVDNDGIEFAGYLTFLSLLALFPFLVLIVATAGFIGQGDLGTQTINILFSYLPYDAVKAIEPRISEITSGPPPALLTISILGAIWTSSSAVEGMRSVLNRAYQVSNPPTYVLRRLTSILQLILFTLIIIIVMAAIVFTPIVIAQLEQWSGVEMPKENSDSWRDLFTYFGAGLLLAVVANLYFFLPNIKQNLLAVLPGAALVVVLWIAGAKGFTFYIANVDQMNLIYGSLGGFIATMLFFFVMNVIFIYGAEFNHLVASALGSKVEEREHVQGEEESIELGSHHTKKK